TDLLANSLVVERLEIDRADHAVRIAVRLEVDRDAAAQQQRAVMCGLMVVAVEQDEITLGDESRQDDLVGGRGAVEDEIRPLGAEDLRRLLLREQRRPLMREEVAEL